MARWSLKKYYGKKVSSAKGDSYVYSEPRAQEARRDEEAAKSARGGRLVRKHARNERWEKQRQTRKRRP